MCNYFEQINAKKCLFFHPSSIRVIRHWKQPNFRHVQLPTMMMTKVILSTALNSKIRKKNQQSLVLCPYWQSAIAYCCARNCPSPLLGQIWVHTTYASMLAFTTVQMKPDAWMRSTNMVLYNTGRGMHMVLALVQQHVIFQDVDICIIDHEFFVGYIHLLPATLGPYCNEVD